MGSSWEELISSRDSFYLSAQKSGFPCNIYSWSSQAFLVTEQINSLWLYLKLCGTYHCPPSSLASFILVFGSGGVSPQLLMASFLRCDCCDGLTLRCAHPSFRAMMHQRLRWIWLCLSWGWLLHSFRVQSSHHRISGWAFLREWVSSCSSTSIFQVTWVGHVHFQTMKSKEIEKTGLEAFTAIGMLNLIIKIGCVLSLLFYFCSVVVPS